MKKTLILLAISIFFISCNSGYESVLKQPNDKYMDIAMDYQEKFDNYLHFKFDGASGYYSSSITPPVKWMIVKRECPEIYEEFILPSKIVWDSLQHVPRERTLYEGVNADIVAHKIKMKELDKIKVKKSQNVEINTD
jgi:hypothetical protein